MSLFGLPNVKYVSSLSRADSSRESHPIFSSKFPSDVMMSIFHLFKTLSSRVMFSFYHKVRKAYFYNKSCCYKLFMVKVWFELWAVVKNASQSNQHLILFFTNSELNILRYYKFNSLSLITISNVPWWLLLKEGLKLNYCQSSISIINPEVHSLHKYKRVF